MRRLIAAYLFTVLALFAAWWSFAQAGWNSRDSNYNIAIASGGCPGGTTTWDPVNIGSNWTLSGGNLVATQNTITNSGNEAIARSTTSHSTGKYYAEFTPSGGAWAQVYSTQIGLTNSGTNLNSYLGNTATSGSMDNGGLTFLINNISVGSEPSYVSGNVIGEAIDFGAQLIWLRVNAGNWNDSGTANPATGAGGYSLSTLSAGPYYAAVGIFDSGAPGAVWTANFGAASPGYANAAPAGFCNW